jgi:hypothetical protein
MIVKSSDKASPVKAKIAKFREYLDYFERHYDNVQMAWKFINDRCQGKGFRFISDDFVWHSIDAEVLFHDESKLSINEFIQYRRRWFPVEGETQDDYEYLCAWEHHKAYNPHHWENWTANQSGSMYADIFLVSMVIDWVAMGFELGDTAKEYYEKNKEKILLPDWAIKLMYEIFDCIYPDSIKSWEKEYAALTEQWKQSLIE